jgi:DNA-binding response OmpR family regulator
MLGVCNAWCFMAAARTRPEQASAVILVVEDDVLVRATIADHLRDGGFKVIEARDADEALDILEAMPVDLVFTDIQMPGSMDGLALASFIRQRHPSLPVLLTSSVARPNEVVSELDAPLIEKPYHYDEVERRIRLLVGSKDPD